MNIRFACVACILALLPAPLAAQQGPESLDADGSGAAYKGTVFEGDYLTLGLGAIYNPSYDGSDDYVITPVPLIQGRLGGIGIQPRPAGIALDFLPPSDKGAGFKLGIAAKLNRNRVTRITDRVVFDYGKRSTGIEIGPTMGLSLPAVLNPYDSLTLSTDVLWDVAGASKGMTINPSITYFTPLSRGMAVSVSLSARHVDDRYADYYYSVPVAPAAVAPADRLPLFTARGGFDKIGAIVFAAVDIDGDLTNGGFSIFTLAGYSRMIGDAADTPFTAIRGSADQWVAGTGIGYTF